MKEDPPCLQRPRSRYFGSSGNCGEVAALGRLIAMDSKEWTRFPAGIRVK